MKNEGSCPLTTATIDRLIYFLEDTANTLDQMARDSLTGGWSTHQVDAHRRLADACRRQAAEAKFGRLGENP